MLPGVKNGVKEELGLCGRARLYFPTAASWLNNAHFDSPILVRALTGHGWRRPRRKSEIFSESLEPELRHGNLNPQREEYLRLESERLEKQTIQSNAVNAGNAHPYVKC